jgi:hypothetical protein
MEAQSAEPLGSLTGQELGQVWFVRDYVELIFEGGTFGKLSCYVWPTLVTGADGMHRGDRDYRNELCSLIGHGVQDVSVLEVTQEGRASVEEEIRITFDNGVKLHLSLAREVGELPEAVAYNDSETSWLVW